MKYFATALDAVGHTPLVRINRCIAGSHALVLGKLESLNPSGSTKDRIALAMVDAAERAGSLKPGGTIVEPTSGNTGAALALVAAVRGYRCILVVPQKVSEEKIAAMRAYGAEVVVAPDVASGSAEAYTALADQLAREIPGAYMPDQYRNHANPAAHEATTGVEIWEQTGGRVTHVVAGIGTGGTLCGIARALKARKSDVCIVGVDPHGSIYSGGKPGYFAVEGIGRDYLPETLDLSVIDRIERIEDREAFDMARRAASEEGLLVGGSSGAALVAAARVVRELESAAVVVVILTDSGRAYFSKIFDDGWMQQNGFGRPWQDTLGAVVAASAGPIDRRFVDRNDTLREAETIMREAGVDLLAVVDNDLHVGNISLQTIMEALHRDRSRLEMCVGEVMGAPFPAFDESAVIDDAYPLLRFARSRIMVTQGGRPAATLGARHVVAYTMDR